MCFSVRDHVCVCVRARTDYVDQTTNAIMLLAEALQQRRVMQQDLHPNNFTFFSLFFSFL